MIGDVVKTCLECIAVAVKCLDGKILHYVKNHFLNLIYIKSAKDRKLKIILLNRAGKIWSICLFLQVKFRSFLEILQLLVFITVILKTSKNCFFKSL